MNVSPIGKVTKLVKSFQAMFLKYTEAHMALIQALVNVEVYQSPKAKSLTKLIKPITLTPSLEFFESAMCSPMFCSSGGLHGNTEIFIGCGMVSFYPNIVERPCVRLVDGAKAGNTELVRHVYVGTI
jgi:hypothetical protein